MRGYDHIQAPGGLEYRFEITEPDWDTSEKRVSDLIALYEQFEEWGRKRNPKKKRLKEVMQEWPEADAYVAIRALLSDRFPHPAVTMNTDSNAMYEALGRVFHDGGEAEGQYYYDEYGCTVEGLREEPPESVGDRDPLLSVFWGEWLREVAEASGPNPSADKLEQYFREMDQPWALAQAVLGSLTLYCGKKIVLNTIASTYDVDEPHRKWRSMGDIGGFFLQVQRGTADADMRPHSPHNTMKANSTSAATVASDDFQNEQWLAQTKYDGARLFVHHSGDGDIRAYTGGMRDVTAALPELDDIDWPDAPFIFDAEATPYDDDGNPIPFENIMTRLTRTGDIDADDYDTTVVFKFFDCMYWHDRDITRQTYEDRFQLVRMNFPIDNVAQTGNDLESTFHTAVDEGHEGLVLKRKDGTYMPGGRHSQWLKWKPEPETLDVVILDCQRGSGRLSDRMGAVEVGLEFEGGFESVGYVGTGFSDEERLEIWRNYEAGEYVDMSTVMEVEYEELQPNDNGWGLRFPRFKRFRPDGDVDTLARAAKLQDRSDEFREWADG